MGGAKEALSDCAGERAFQPCAALTTVADELLRRFADADEGPWADGPPVPTERLLHIDIRRGADDAVLDAIVALAREHELVLYDLQGPSVHLPDDPADSGSDEPPSLVDHLWIVLIGLAAAGVFWLGWWIDVPVLVDPDARRRIRPERRPVSALRSRLRAEREEGALIARLLPLPVNARPARTV